MHAAPHSGGQRRTLARGFTLIELLVTITLLGILVTLSIPSFTGWIRNSQIRTVADALQTGLRTAQAESVRRNRQVVMFFTEDEPALNVVPVTHPQTDAAPVLNGKRWVLQAIGQFGEPSEYITGGKLSDVASNIAISNDQAAKAICFNSAGRLATTGAGPSGTKVAAACQSVITTFSVGTSADDRPLNVIVQLGGQLRMCDPKRPAMSSASPDGCP